jgi:hypothetical protein
MSPKRQARTIEFMPPDKGAVAEALAAARAAGSGWVNLLPGVPENAADPDPPTGLFAFFGSRAQPVTMATIMPPKKDRRATTGFSVGLMHPTGAKAVARLTSVGVPLPEGWMVRQDHPRRGIVLETPVDAAEADVIAWCISAGTALNRAEMTGEWRAVVYEP